MTTIPPPLSKLQGGRDVCSFDRGTHVRWVFFPPLLLLS
jgi:hypothetical protein